MTHKYAIKNVIIYIALHNFNIVYFFYLNVHGKHRYMHLFLRLHSKPILNHLLTQAGKYKDKFISNKMQF